MGRSRPSSSAGVVFTPRDVAQYMVEKLFAVSPQPDSRILDAGCGDGAFIEAIIRWCRARDLPIPKIVGVEVNPLLVARARAKFRDYAEVKIVNADFLTASVEELGGPFDYVISNPPYVSYEKIPPDQRGRYRGFKSAVGRYDIYMLFFEKAIEVLKEEGRLVFITPEKYLYVLSARALRRILAQYEVEEIEMLPEDVFGDVLAYPAITVINKRPPTRPTVIKNRDGKRFEFHLPGDGSPWLPAYLKNVNATVTLRELALRISPGVATGRDEVFVRPREAVPIELREYAYPTVSGEELSRFRPGAAVDPSKLRYVILTPYTKDGRLVEEDSPLVKYLAKWRRELEERYAVKRGKRWYAFHEDPPMGVILKPKILWKDIAREPAFYIDPTGSIIPRHSVYYLVPKNPAHLKRLVEYLNSEEVKQWLRENCQKAANGFLRLQTHVLEKLPVAAEIWTL